MKTDCCGIIQSPRGSVAHRKKLWMSICYSLLFARNKVVPSRKTKTTVFQLLDTHLKIGRQFLTLLSSPPMGLQKDQVRIL